MSKNTAQLKYTINTKVDDKGVIMQDVSSDFTTHINKTVMDTQDEAVKESLCKLGWTPPTYGGYTYTKGKISHAGFDTYEELQQFRAYANEFPQIIKGVHFNTLTNLWHFVDETERLSDEGYKTIKKANEAADGYCKHVVEGGKDEATYIPWAVYVTESGAWYWTDDKGVETGRYKQGTDALAAMLEHKYLHSTED